MAGSQSMTVKVMVAVIIVLSAVFIYGVTRPPQYDSAVSAPGQVTWHTDLDDALSDAESRGCLVFADFSAAWCIWCKKLDKETFPDPKVQAELARFSLLKVDVDKDSKTAQSYRVSGLPSMIIMDAEGNEVDRNEGFLPAAGLVGFLKKH